MTQSRKPEETGPSGFFVSAEGSPMYRITGQDTLSDIAKSHLGRSSRWVQILEMNRNVLRDGNELKIGTVLKLPADASRVQVVGTPRQFR
jgi:nucleoid-associated protein YgaU